jgi:hypothetical protein
MLNNNLQNLVMLVQNKKTNKFYRVITNPQTLQSQIFSKYNNVATVNLNTITKYYHIVEMEIQNSNFDNMEEF